MTLPTKKQQQGEQSRELILDATERLMATRGYAATSISDIRKACGLPPSSIYWHFRLQGRRAGGGDGTRRRPLLRGDPDSEGADRQQLAVTAHLQAQHPDFLRLFYLLSLERSDDPAVAAVMRRVRDTAIDAIPRRDQSAAAGRYATERRTTASSPNSPRSPSRCPTGCSSPNTSNPTRPTSNGCTSGCPGPRRP